MKILLLLAPLLLQNTFASEGFYHPESSITSSAVAQALYSVVSFSPGSGVVVDENKIITAAHVVAGCECPIDEKPSTCEKKFRVPEKINISGRVEKWKVGTTRLKLICGLNSGVEEMKILAQVFERFNHLPANDEVSLFYPREEVAILEFDNSVLQIPSIPVRDALVKPTEKLNLLGYPGVSLRNRKYKESRYRILHDTLIGLFELRDILKLPSYISLASFEKKVSRLFSEMNNRIENLPAESIERQVLVFGSFSYVSYPVSLMSLYKKNLLDAVCEKWGMSSEDCYESILANQLEEVIKDLEVTLSSIGNEIPSDYPEVDESLKISFGLVERYLETRSNFYGLLSTDVDAVSGNSGGPLLDDDGKLVGIASTGPWGTSISYKPHTGVSTISHQAIRFYLNKLTLNQ